MKKILSLSLVFLAAFIGLSFTAVEDNLVITVKKGTIKINGTAVNSEWMLSTYEAKLGKSDRTRDGYNITHTYDQKGLVLFEGKTILGHVNEFQIYFSNPSPNDVSPKGMFTGSLKIDHLVLHKSTDSETMLKKLKKWKKTESYTEHSYRMQYKMTSIYFQFSDDEKSLVKVSIGPASSKA